jgi:predicted small lipoprotein YifL
MRRFTLALIAACVLTACGQKGSLYLPEAERETVPASPAAPVASPLPAAADTLSAEERARQNAARATPN